MSVRRRKIVGRVLRSKELFDEVTKRNSVLTKHLMYLVRRQNREQA